MRDEEIIHKCDIKGEFSLSNLDEVLKRLNRQYDAYEKERNSDDEEGIVDVSLACSLADSIPYLVKQIEELKKNQPKIIAGTNDFPALIITWNGFTYRRT